MANIQNVDLPTIKFVWDFIQTVIIVGISIYVWIVNNDKVNAKKISALEDKSKKEIDSLKVKQAELETTLRHMPDKRSMHNLHQRLNEQAKVLHTIEGELKGIGDVNALILKTLMQEKGGN